MLDGGRWSWVEVEMNWAEVDGPEWRWVHSLVIPILQHECQTRVTRV